MLETLLVGGGNTGLEKVRVLLKSSPGVRLTIVSKTFHPEIKELAQQNPAIRLIQRGVRIRDLTHKHLVILATNDRKLHERIREHAHKRRLLVNVADTPELCDFYLGSVVTKGHVKIGISTNGKSPTMAKRMREYFEAILPDGMNELIERLHTIRERVKGGLQQKVKVLNALTANWLEENS